MKKLLIASVVSLALMAGSAAAADLVPSPYAKAPLPPPPPAISWTGCYVNAGVGYGFWKQDHYDEDFPGLVADTPTASSGGDGWLGRLGGGCDYQVAPSWLIGAFADYDFMDLQGTFQDTFSGLLGTEKETGAWAVGGRLGYLVTPTLLAFVDGGYTQAHFNSIGLNTDTVPSLPTIFSIPSNTYHGWFLGGGAEYALNMPWMPVRGLFWRSEWRYAQYQSADLIISPVTVTGTAIHTTKDVQTITSGLVWRFNFGH